jgi:hypothetical protein
MDRSRRRYGFVGGVTVSAAGLAALLWWLPVGHAEGGPPVVAVHAADYAYQGVPATLRAGEVRFSFTNDSKTEGHEMELFRINDGVTESFDQILAEDEARHDQARQQAQQGQQGQPGQPGQQGGQPEQPQPAPKMTFFATTGAGPGATAKMDLIGNLPAGRYGMACFLPVANDQSGTPHYKKGMKAEFTVK